MNNLNSRALRSSVLGTIALAALLFVPAGTLDYRQAWVFMAIFVGATAGITVHLAIHDPALLERRMKAGPAAEGEATQKVIMSIAMTGFLAVIAVPGLDHRFGWSAVPAGVALFGDALIALGFLFVFFVLRTNTYSASTIQIAEGQTVISTGPYAIVRHPMYAGALALMTGVPLALGSWWGLLPLMLLLPALIWRLLDEERFLIRNLPGYAEYRKQVRPRLLPFIW